MLPSTILSYQLSELERRIGDKDRSSLTLGSAIVHMSGLAASRIIWNPEQACCSLFFFVQVSLMTGMDTQSWAKLKMYCTLAVYLVH